MLNIFIFAVPSFATWQVVYSEDFSSDPSWTTNNFSNYYWDSATQAYFQREIDGSNEYAYKIIPELQNGNSFRLEFDINKTSSSGASDARFGFYDSDMTNYSRWNLHVNQYGLFLLEWNTVSEEPHQYIAHIPEGVDTGIWHHVILEYISGIGTAYAQVTLKDTGTLVGETTQAVGVLQRIDRIAMSTIGDSFGGTGESFIDNVVVSAPESSTLLLLGLGGLALSRKRRA